MEALAFVFWMIGWPLIGTIDRVARKHVGIEDSDRTIFLSAVAGAIIWAVVGNLLWGRL
jgi:hypothetical protein